jgi:hypothetical protein
MMPRTVATWIAQSDCSGELIGADPAALNPPLARTTITAAKVGHGAGVGGIIMSWIGPLTSTRWPSR